MAVVVRLKIASRRLGTCRTVVDTKARLWRVFKDVAELIALRCSTGNTGPLPPGPGPQAVGSSVNWSVQVEFPQGCHCGEERKYRSCIHEADMMLL